MATSAIAATSPAASTLLRGAQTLTRQPRFPGIGIALDEILERLLGLRRLLESLIAQRQLVEGRRHLVTLGKRSLHLRVLGFRAVEHRLREVALTHSILRVVGQIAGRIALHVVAEFLE